jgi:zinc protease
MVSSRGIASIIRRIRVFPARKDSQSSVSGIALYGRRPLRIFLTPAEVAIGRESPSMTRTAKIALSCMSVLTMAQAQKISVPFEKYSLDNGLTVILHEDHRLPICAVDLWYRVGAKDEPVKRSGFAHLFEHLMFMGTWRAPEGEFDQVMEKGGGANNATTSSDRTNYFSWGPANLLPTLLWLEADRLEHLGEAMTQRKLDLQREVVRNERRQSYENEPYGMAELEIEPLMYPAGHPYHIPVIGTHEDLIAASVQDVKDFFATWYVPNNCSLVVAGDFDPAETKKLILALFGSLAKKPAPPHRDAAPVRLELKKEKQLTDPNVQFPRVSLVWHSPKQLGPGDAECDLIGQLLSDGIISRLQKRLIYDETLANSVAAYQQSQRLGSLFRIDVIAAEGVALPPIEAAVDAELERLRAEGPAESELVRVKAQLETETIMGLQRLLERADRLNAYEAVFGEPDGFERDLARYRATTRESIRDWARKVLVPERLVLRVFPEPDSPESKASAAEPEPEEGAASGPESRSAAPASMPVSAPATRPVVAKTAREDRPVIGPPTSYRPPAALTFSIGDDRVLFHERHELPLVRIVVRIGGGANLDPAGKAGLADLTARLLKEGAGRLEALAFSEAIDQLGASFDTAADNDSTLIQLTVLRSNLEKAAALFFDAILEPRFDEAPVKRVKTQLLGSLRQRDDQPALVGRLVTQAMLFGREHPIGRPVEGTIPSVGAITLADLKSFWAAHLTRDLQVLAAGDVKPDELRAILGPRLAARPKRAAAGLAPIDGVVPVARADKLRFVIVDRPNSPQTVIRFAWPGIAYSDERRIPLAFATTVLGGSFTSRLNNNLREQKGYTYGAGAGIDYYAGTEDPRKGPSAVSATASVRADVTGASIREFLAELERMRKGDITSDELGKVRSTLRNGRIQSGESLGGLVAELDAVVTYGLGPDSLAQDFAKIDQVDLATINAAARAVLVPDGGVLVLVGEAKVIKKQLDGLSLPHPTVVTADQFLSGK